MNNAKQLADALRGLLADKYLADPVNADRMAPAREALAAYDAAAPVVTHARVAHYANGRAVHAEGAHWECSTHLPDDDKSPAEHLRDNAAEDIARGERLILRAARSLAIADYMERDA